MIMIDGHSMLCMISDLVVWDAALPLHSLFQIERLVMFDVLESIAVSVFESPGRIACDRDRLRPYAFLTMGSCLMVDDTLMTGSCLTLFAGGEDMLKGTFRYCVGAE